MRLSLLKRYVPRSLYGRAALILLVPAVTLQLVVSVVFIQRHFDGVTRQMTRAMALELRYLLNLVEEAPDAEASAMALDGPGRALGFRSKRPDAAPDGNLRKFYDLTGLRVIETLRDAFPEIRAIDLASDSRRVELWVATRHGELSLSFDRRRVSASNPHQLFVWLILTGILLTFVAFLFLRNQLRPIKRLAEASEAFGRGRSLPYTPSGAVEVRAAGRAFIGMRSRIERQTEQRTIMLSGISHDLSTPLTRLRLALSMQEDGSEIEAMLRDVADMERLVDEFLAFARGEALDEAVETDPERLIRDVMARYPNAQVRLAEVVGEGVATLQPLAVERALENLVGNALRHGTRCELRLGMDDAWVRIAVEDDGPGIPPERREEAMKPFSRLDASRNQDRGGGVGLGLAIASDVARQHGGRLELGESALLGGLSATLALARRAAQRGRENSETSSVSIATEGA